MDPTALTTLLLFHIPKVRRLQLQEYYISQCIFLDVLRRSVRGAVMESLWSFGSLASFRKLENLNIPWSLLASIDPPETSPILPPNLRQITINNSISQPYFGGQNSPGYDLVEWLLRYWQLEAPRLERVLVEDGSWSWKEKVDLEMLAEETGIALVWVFLDFKGAVSRRG
ncbi:hypothetical protein BJY01DRAFT_253995 [Aspergillus pseudoustus]|uniref:Uncharacterized protein n=1 Tax=Aspergillus pseudoustus TaxID=1810923 RepID=A0ABR4IWS3_9EURO